MVFVSQEKFQEAMKQGPKPNRGRRQKETWHRDASQTLLPTTGPWEKQTAWERDVTPRQRCSNRNVWPCSQAWPSDFHNHPAWELQPHCFLVKTINSMVVKQVGKISWHSLLCKSFFPFTPWGFKGWFWQLFRTSEVRSQSLGRTTSHV